MEQVRRLGVVGVGVCLWGMGGPRHVGDCAVGSRFILCVL